MSNKSTYLNKGKLERSNDNSNVDYSFDSAHDFFSIPANIITGIGGVSGGRVLLGSKATLQAISLLNREAPLVQSVASHKDESFIKKIGKHYLSVRAKQDGTVSNITEDNLEIRDDNGVKHSYDIYNNYNLGRKSGLHNYLVVKLGDKVKKGDLLAYSNYTDSNGDLALGVNLRTAIMPYRSNNFEDALVLTESGAKKLNAEQLLPIRLEKKMGIEVNRNKYISLFPNKYSNKQLSNIDQDGVVKRGTVLQKGDPIILALSPKALKSTDMALGKLSKVLSQAYKDNTVIWDYEHSGEVVDVAKTDNLVSVNIKTVRPVQVGDKLSSVFGAKGVCGSIIPDTQAPIDKDGKPVDIILNSMSITSRVAPALPLSLALGKYAEKIGKPVKMPHFTASNESAVKNVIKLLKDNDIKDTEELYDPVSGSHMNVLVGPIYTTRLVHISEDKESSRSQGLGYNWEHQPTKTENESSKRIGNLATAALLSHGATAVLRDLGTVKSTKNDEYWRRLKLGLQVPSPGVPFIFDKFVSSLQGAGVKVDKKDNSFNILPMTDKDVSDLSIGEIKHAGTFKIKGEKSIAEKGGLFDPTIVGVLGDKYNHVGLNFSVPNPISEDFLRKLLKVTKNEYERLIVTGEIKQKLESLDVDAEIEKYLKYLKSGKKTERSDSVKLVAFLRALKQGGKTPKDLLLSKIPIIPAQYRPMMIQGNMVISSPVNTLYKELIQNNNALKNVENVPEHVVDRLKKDQYAAVKAVYGLGDAITVKSKEKGIKGLLSTTIGSRGGSGKSTMFQAKVVNKPLDLVGRAVLTPDAKLDLDEASVPQDILWKTYSPFIVRRLVMKGVPATKALEYVEVRNPLAIQALNDELKMRPGIISRDPALHKFNLTGFYLKPNANIKDKTIKLNPLVFKGFNADNDGDQLNVNIPVSEEARQEVIEKMLPSRNLLSSKTFSPMFTPSNESALGLFQASTENNNNTPKKFKSEDEVLKAFNQGLLHVGDNVEIG